MNVVESLVVPTTAYLGAATKMFAAKAPRVKSRNKAADVFLRGRAPMRDVLFKTEEANALRTALLMNEEFRNLFAEWERDRKHLARTIGDYAASVMSDLVLKLFDRAPKLALGDRVQSLVRDFLDFVTSRTMTFMQRAPLHNFEMADFRVQLDDDTWIGLMGIDEDGSIQDDLRHPDTISCYRDKGALQHAIYHGFALPVSTTSIGPPDFSIAYHGRLLLRMLNPPRAVEIHDARTWATGWGLGSYGTGVSGSGGSRVVGAPVCVTPQAASRLPGLWQQWKRMVIGLDADRIRFWHKARVRLLRAAETFDFAERVLDGFIVIDALILLPSERWARRDHQKGRNRLAMLLSPGNNALRDDLKNKIPTARQQRDTVAHGIDRDYVGFDGRPGSFDTLALEVDRWACTVMLRATRLLFQTGSREASAQLLDEGERDPAIRQGLAAIVLDPEPV